MALVFGAGQRGCGGLLGMAELGHAQRRVFAFLVFLARLSDGETAIHNERLLLLLLLSFLATKDDQRSHLDLDRCDGLLI